jgi:hypothetical protein
MRKYTLISILLLFTLFSYSENQNNQNFGKMVVEDVREIKGQMDSTFYYGKETVNIWKSQVKEYGLKNTLRANSSIFLPFFIFLIMFLVWLKRKK